MTSIATQRLGARKSSDGGVEGHALSQTSPTTQQSQDSRGLRGVHLAGIKPGPSETPQACIAGLREFIRDAGDDDLAFAAWCALGLSIIHEVDGGRA